MGVSTTRPILFMWMLIYSFSDTYYVWVTCGVNGVLMGFKNVEAEICELNNKTAHRTHNNTVSWFIPLQSNSQNSHQTRWKNLEGKLALTLLFSSRPVLAYSACTCSLPYLEVLLNVTQLWGVGLVKLSYVCIYEYDKNKPKAEKDITFCVENLLIQYLITRYHDFLTVKLFLSRNGKTSHEIEKRVTAMNWGHPATFLQ